MTQHRGLKHFSCLNVYRTHSCKMHSDTEPINSGCIIFVISGGEISLKTEALRVGDGDRQLPLQLVLLLVVG